MNLLGKSESNRKEKSRRGLYESPSALACLRYAGTYPLFIPRGRNPLAEGINAKNNRHNYRAIRWFYRLWTGPSMQCVVCVLLIPAPFRQVFSGHVRNAAEGGKYPANKKLKKKPLPVIERLF